jgi:MmpS family membrane protein
MFFPQAAGGQLPMTSAMEERIMAKYSTILPLSAVVAALAVALPAPAHADNPCIDPYVSREARSGDMVCVTPDVRTRTAQENATPDLHRDPNGNYGPLSCAQGWVWREAFDGDGICVTPQIRAQTLADNAASASRTKTNLPNQPVGSSTVRFEVTGDGEVLTIDIDPSSDRFYNQRLPWNTTITVEPDVQLLQVVAVGGDNAGCRIIVDGKVVAEQPAGSAHCTFKRF